MEATQSFVHRALHNNSVHTQQYWEEKKKKSKPACQKNSNLTGHLELGVYVVPKYNVQYKLQYSDEELRLTLIT